MWPSPSFDLSCFRGRRVKIKIMRDPKNSFLVRLSAISRAVSLPVPDADLHRSNRNALFTLRVDKRPVLSLPPCFTSGNADDMLENSDARESRSDRSGNFPDGNDDDL